MILKFEIKKKYSMELLKQVLRNIVIIKRRFKSLKEESLGYLKNSFFLFEEPFQVNLEGKQFQL